MKSCSTDKSNDNYDNNNDDNNNDNHDTKTYDNYCDIMIMKIMIINKNDFKDGCNS